MGALRGCPPLERVGRNEVRTRERLLPPALYTQNWRKVHWFFTLFLIMMRGVKMKKIGLVLATFVVLLASCSNLNLQSRSSEFGSLVLSNEGGRLLVQNEIKSAVATVYGKGIDFPISADAQEVVNGKGFVKIEGIPAGSNRIVRVEAKDESNNKITEYVISAVANIEPDVSTSVNITWSSTVKGNLYYSAHIAKMNVSDAGISEKLDGIAQKITESKIHASLVNFAKIITDFNSIDASSFSVNSYKRKSATVTMQCFGIDGKSVLVADPASSVKVVSGDEATVQIESVLTGTWGVYTKLGDTYTKVGDVEVGENGGHFQIGESEVTPTLPRNEESEYDGIKVLVNKNQSSAYSYIWYWTCLDSNDKPLAAYPDSSENYEWKKFEKLEDDGTYYYKEFKGAAKVNVLIVTASGSKLYTTGNDDADGWNFTAPGIYEITKTGATKQDVAGPSISLSRNTGATFSGASIDVVITVKNCTTARYTTDGTNPYSSSTAQTLTGTKTLSLGAGLSVGGKVTLRVYGDDGTVYTDVSATYEKVEKFSVTRLGAYYTSKQTSFSIWSPDSSNVTVTVTPNGGTAKEYTCVKNFPIDSDYPDAQNIYGVTVQGDLHLAEYQFKIGGKAVRDPYGVMINNKSQQNVVLDLSKTDPLDGWAERPALENREDAIIYEVHVRDFTIDSSSGVEQSKRGKFPGMVQTGTTYGTVKTGIDHLKELGVTHVQILPMYDFGTEMYNWGYDPMNYNIPEEQYSTCPDDYVGRVREVKEMINEFHKNGIRVVMDVVYNHTYSKDMFTGISSKYYTKTDLSGCGNSIDSGVPMVSRFIRDSLEYWVDEYNIDGFRFDLIGIFHRDAVKGWGEYLNVEKFPSRNLLMYGEPWNGYAEDTEDTKKVRYGTTSGMASGHIGVFNGAYREQIKGDNDKKGKAYMFNDKISWEGAIAAGMRGSIKAVKNTTDLTNMWDSMFCYDPEQSINYISAHDNLCLWDKIVHSLDSSDYAKRIDKFGMGIVMTSQGIPFIHAGDEFLRSKAPNGDWTYAHNSYNASDEYNKIRWADKVTNKAVFDYYKDAIALRKETPGMRLTTWDEIKFRMTTKVKYEGASGINCTNDSSLPDKVVVSIIDNNLAIVFNPGNNFTVSLPSGSWTKVFDINGSVSDSSSKICEGTAVTVFKKN